MSMRLPILAAALLVALPASAQLSFSADDFRPTAFGLDGTTAIEGSATVFSTDGSGVSPTDAIRIDALIAQTGEAQTWDFSDLTYIDQQLQVMGQEVDDLSGLPGASEFPSATVAYAVSGLGLSGPGDVSYTYARVSDDAFVTLGTYIEASSSTPEFVSRYVPDGLVHATFPFTFGTSFEDESDVDASPRILTDLFTRVDVDVVGYGTLVLPTGSHECLMVRRAETVDAFTSTTYTWITRDRVAAAASANEVIPGQPIRVAQYYVPSDALALEDSAPSLTLTIAPNPTIATSSIRFSALEAGPAQIRVYDALGREVAVLHNGPLAAGDHSFTTSRLAPGVYIVRVETGARVGAVRLVVTR